MHNHWKNCHHHVSYGLEPYEAYVTILGVNAWFSKRPIWVILPLKSLCLQKI